MQFHVHPSGTGLLLDVQSGLLSGYKHRVVVPLLPEKQAPRPAKRLNPVFVISGKRFVMMTQYMAAVPIDELGPHVADLNQHRLEIVGAIDVLIGGV